MPRILVIDDSQDSLNLMKEILSAGGYDVFTATSANQGLEKLDSFKFDLVITDINMPVKNGFTFIEELRKTVRHKLLQVLVVTYRSDKKDVVKAVSTGADDFLVKPINKESLLQKVEFLLKSAPNLSEGDLNLADYNKSATGTIKTSWNIDIITVTDLGVKIYSNFPLAELQTITLNSPLFTEMKLIHNEFIVNSSRKISENQYAINLVLKYNIEPPHIFNLI